MTAVKRTSSNVCPYLGMKNDANSHMAFPTPLNYCGRCAPAARINLIHQEAFCLGPQDYLQCEVYTDGADQPLPKPLQYTDSSRRASRKRRSPYLLVWMIGFVLLGAILWVVNFTDLRVPSPVINTITPTIQPVEQIVAQTVNAISAMQTSQALLSQTPTLDLNDLTPSLTPTVTLFPTLTSTPTVANTVTSTPSIIPTRAWTRTPTSAAIANQPYSLDIPFGGVRKFVIHRVVAGDNLIVIANRFGSSVESILAVNYSLLTPIKVDMLVIIPFEINNPLGLPILEPYQVVSAQISIEEIAALVQTDLELIK
ncbi:MAG: LysM domain-containing protein, partial [Anaerolineales bacterium]|nr:LysM domain-containing protein [Anaerolineales bacterium]